jgi:hypothetical protein
MAATVASRGGQRQSRPVDEIAAKHGSRLKNVQSPEQRAAARGVLAGSEP